MPSSDGRRPAAGGAPWWHAWDSATSSVVPVCCPPQSWYSTQLFYSDEFYQATVPSSAEELYDFVELWLDSYQNLTADAMAEEASSPCSDLPVNENTQAICAVALAYSGDWAALINDMLLRASSAYGDANFVKRLATPEGRVAPLQDTDLITQTALTPTSRIVGGVGQNDTIVYLGPKGQEDVVFSTPIPAAHVVSSSDTPAKGWWYGGTVITAFDAPSPDPTKFSFSAWNDFYLYPGNDGTVLIPDTFGSDMIGELQDPFVTSGGTTVVQAASTSSALLGSYSGAVPSIFSQTFSVKRHAIETSDKGLPEKAIELRALDGVISDKVYGARLFYPFAVCSQWPLPCGSADSHFLDGIATDTTALSTTIGNYQSSIGANLSKIIKVILTNTNQKWDDTGTSANPIPLLYDL